MTRKASVKCSATISGKVFEIDQFTEDEGASTHDSVLNAATGTGPTTINGGGGTADVTLGGIWADDTFVIGERVTFYYDSGGSKTVGALVSAESQNNVALVGADTNFPANATEGVLVKDTSIDITFEGNDLKCFAVYCDAAATVTFWASDVSKLAVDLTAGISYYWIENGGFTNPLAGESIDEVSFVIYEADGDEIVKFALLQDNVT